MLNYAYKNYSLYGDLNELIKHIYNEANEIIKSSWNNNTK